MKNDINPIINFPTVLTKYIKPELLYAAVIKQAMLITDCDGGTFYTPGKDCLIFRHLITRSKGVDMGYAAGADKIRPVPMEKKYVCAYAAITGQTLNIRDVYYAKEYDFEGTFLYDQSNNYRTHSMLVIPLYMQTHGLQGVLQLINALDENGNCIQFTAKHVQLMNSLGAMVALKLDDMRLSKEL
ncbi:MAG: GAF domain-containing protein [Lachnospiraceae bacterium]|nr:GAF domain-containing protein [Lachnospiraceae bacterium]